MKLAELSKFTLLILFIMDAEQRKKWEEKLRKAKALDAAKSLSESSDAGNTTPDINTARKKFRSSFSDKLESASEEDIDSTPKPDIEDDIVIEVNATKTLSDNPEDNLEDKKVVIRSKSKGTKGYQG